MCIFWSRPKECLLWKFYQNKISTKTKHCRKLYTRSHKTAILPKDHHPLNQSMAKIYRHMTMFNSSHTLCCRLSREGKNHKVSNKNGSRFHPVNSIIWDSKWFLLLSECGEFNPMPPSHILWMLGIFGLQNVVVDNQSVTHSQNTFIFSYHTSVLKIDWYEPSRPLKPIHFYHERIEWRLLSVFIWSVRKIKYK